MAQPLQSGRKLTRRRAHGLARTFCIVLALAGPGVHTAVAQPVRGGEHGSFTRLTLPLTPGQDWSIEPGSHGYRLHIRGKSDPFDLSQAFDRIGRSRIDDIAPGEAPGTLKLGLACRCQIDAFDNRAGLLVLDIREDGGRSMPSATTAGIGPPPPRPRLPDDQPPIARAVWPGPSGSAWVEWAGMTDPADATLPEGSAQDQAAATVPSGPDAPSEIPATQPPLDPEARAMALDMLRARIAEAAEIGLVSIDPGPHPLAEDAGASSASTVAAPSEAGKADNDPQGASTRPAPLPLDARTALAPRPMLEPPNGAAPASCPPPEAFALPSPAAPGPTDRQIASARARLVGEFDRPDPEAARAYIDLLLYLGFGAEARATLAEFPDAHPAPAIARALSHLVEGEAPPAPDLVTGLALCDGPVALWAALALPPDATAPVNTRALLAAHADLPTHLRRELGPPLVTRLLARGDHDTAAALRNAMARAGRGDTLQHLVDAERALAQGDPARALRTLSRAGAQGPPQVEALVLEAQALLAMDAPILPQLRETLAAHAGEAGRTAAGQRLLETLALVEAATGAFEQAFDRAAALAPEDRGLVTALLWRLTRDAEDAQFLHHALSEPVWDTATLPPELRLQAGRRLIDMGFPESVHIIIPRSHIATEDERRLLAEAALAQRDLAPVPSLPPGVGPAMAAGQDQPHTAALPRPVLTPRQSEAPADTAPGAGSAPHVAGTTATEAEKPLAAASLALSRAEALRSAVAGELASPPGLRE